MMNQAIKKQANRCKPMLAGALRKIVDPRVADEDTIQCKPIPAGAPSSNRLTQAGWITED